ncbi:class I SAM-dependent methyltransferase [Rhodobacteraceae bacterium W635]|uniref:SAM-dependent methyltransferase n=1 Tax=Nioella halotolerans TaxID=2303578 RepID=UPI000E3DEDDC|nr:class I SAM-dependent methyltransferase [Rhodobacteraceae bacterium W635]
MFFLTTRIKRDFLDSCSRITEGSLRLRTPEGEVHDFGQGAPEAEMQIHDWSVVTACAAKGDIGLGETYVAGLWDTPAVADLCEVALLNMDRLQTYVYGGFWARVGYRLLNTVMRANSRLGAARNIRKHYDVGNEFYALWLDPGMTYSAALFDAGDDDLARAQGRKNARILDRVTGDRVLEIGCGWGGFAEAAADRGHHVTGVTLSPSQKGYADARLDGRADIRLQDYRDVTGQFDSIVSIEMIEAVGEKYWPTYFETLKARLADGGRAVVQAITVPDSYFHTYRRGSDFIRSHIFPGGMLLSPAVIRAQAARVGLEVVDDFAFGPHYAKTCAAWQARMEAEQRRIARLDLPAEFLRGWRFYLGSCTAAFLTGQTGVSQVALAHAGGAR